jgi:hypothetical protein
MVRPAAVIAVVVALAMSAPASALAQRRKPGAPGAAPDQIAVSIDAKVAGKSYQASGNGECKHADEASIHGVSAALWMVQFESSKDASLKRLNLTLWRPKDGSPDQLSLMLEGKAGSHRIQTGGAGGNAGEGSVTILPSGPGGRLEISGKESEGKPVQITIECSSFGEVEAEGG